MPDDESSPEFAAAYDRALTSYVTNRKPRGRPGAGDTSPAAFSSTKRTIVGYHVYFLRDGDLVKIGYASSVNKRISKLQIGSGRHLTLIGAVPGGRDVERFIHWQFRKHRIRGEWFRIEGALAAFIEECLGVLNLCSTEYRGQLSP